MLPYIIIIKDNLNEKEAFELEKYLIKNIGRYDLKKGPLCNFTDGGEGSSGRKQTDIMKTKLRNERIGNRNPFFNKKHSENTKEVLSIQKQGNKNPFFGKHHSVKSIKKVATAIEAINPLNNKIIKFISIIDASRKLGITRATIRFSIENKSINKKTGYKFRHI